MAEVLWLCFFSSPCWDKQGGDLPEKSVFSWRVFVQERSGRACKKCRNMQGEQTMPDLSRCLQSHAGHDALAYGWNWSPCTAFGYLELC